MAAQFRFTLSAIFKSGLVRGAGIGWISPFRCINKSIDEMKGFNAFVQLFLPKDKVFYSLFEEVADCVGRMGQLLKAVVSEPDYDKRAVLILQLENQEHVNDDLTHRIF